MSLFQPMGVSLRFGLPLLIVCVVADPASAQSTDRRVLVQRLQPVGVEAALARTLEEALTLELGGRKGITVVSSAELEQTVQVAQEQVELGCDDLEQCMVEVQQKLQVSELISGKLSRLGGELIVTLGLLDVDKRAVQRRVTRQAKQVAQLRAALPAVVDELLGAAPARAAFRLESGQELKLAVMPLSARGVPAATADAMTQILSAELNGIESVSVISRDDIKAMLDKVQVESELGCTDNMECVVEIGAALGLSKLVAGTVGKIEEAYVISLQLIDTRQAEVVNRVLESFEGDADELKHAIKLGAYQLTGVDYKGRPGRVAFTFNVDDAEVRLGAQKLSLRGSELALGKLTPGRYSLRVIPDPDDYYPLQTDIYVAPGGANVRTFSVRETPTPWYGSWWFWTAVGVVVAGAAGTTIVLLNQDAPSTGSGTVSVGLSEAR